MSSFQDQDYYQLLGLTRTCSKEDIRRAFRQVSKSKHPDLFSGAAKTAAEQEYVLIVKAFNTLKNEKSRGAYDRQLQHLSGPMQTVKPEQINPEKKAEQYFKQGVGQFEQKNFTGAVEAFQRSLFYKETAEVFYYKGLAESHLSRFKKEAVFSLQKAVSLDGSNVKYLKALIKGYLSFGLASRAKPLIQQAMALAPGDAELRQIAQQFQPEKSKKSGILGGLFGKK